LNVAAWGLQSTWKQSFAHGSAHGSIKRLQRYDDATVFKMAAVRHLGFLKFNFLRVGAVKRPILHQHNKFRKDRSNCCGDTAIFVIFQNGGRPPSWICWAPIATTHDDHLMVSIIVPNLVEIDAVVR